MSLSLRLPSKPVKPVRLSLAVPAEPVVKTEEVTKSEEVEVKAKKTRRPRQPPYTFTEVNERLSEVLKSMSALLAEAKRLVAKTNTAHRAEATTTRAKKRKPSGFCCLTKLDQKMRDFLALTTDEDRTVKANGETKLIPRNIGEDDKFLRHMITKVVHNYMTRNNLRDEKDKRILLYNDDPALKTLFLTDEPLVKDTELMNGIRSGDVALTYLMLQSVLKYRYVKD